jgi:hypothetical protein
MLMSDTSKIVSSDEAWDERGLGADPNFVRRSEGVDETRLNDAAGLVAVSIRLQKALIEDFRFIAELSGDIGYQTLMRQVLNRFADCEKKRILREVVEARREQKEREENQQLDLRAAVG